MSFFRKIGFCMLSSMTMVGVAAAQAASDVRAAVEDAVLDLGLRPEGRVVSESMVCGAAMHVGRTRSDGLVMVFSDACPDPLTDSGQFEAAAEEYFARVEGMLPLGAAKPTGWVATSLASVTMRAAGGFALGVALPDAASGGRTLVLPECPVPIEAPGPGNVPADMTQRYRTGGVTSDAHYRYEGTVEWLPEPVPGTQNFRWIGPFVTSCEITPLNPPANPNPPTTGGGPTGGSSQFSIAFSNIQCYSNSGNVTIGSVSPAAGGGGGIPTTIVTCQLI